MESQQAVQRMYLLETAELRRIWERFRGSAPPPPLKRLLLRELAWEVQSARSGLLDAETRRMLRAAVSGARFDPSNPRRSAKKRPYRHGRLKTGAKLLRTWHGRRHVVTVLDDGKRFRYRGETYKSLTKIAEEITSAHWSGPRFFGLDRIRGTS